MFSHYTFEDFKIKTPFLKGYRGAAYGLLSKSRESYVSKMFDLLNPGGKLVGLLFNHEFGHNFPPFGGTQQEYQKLFEPKFITQKMEIAYNSIKPRAGRELFILLKK